MRIPKGGTDFSAKVSLDVASVCGWGEDGVQQQPGSAGIAALWERHQALWQWVLAVPSQWLSCATWCPLLWCWVQVHVASINGEEVVVKVQRPGLKELFDIDLRNIRTLVRAHVVHGAWCMQCTQLEHGLPPALLAKCARQCAVAMGCGCPQPSVIS